jgi:hypothetical protein
MHRQIVYPGQIPLETDILSTNKDAYQALAKLAQALFGNNTVVNGLSAGATSPASLAVLVQPGEIYSLQTMDTSAYSTLGTDASQVLKQGIITTTTTLSTPAPGTAGQSINYLVEVGFVESDANSVVLPYYNASNPDVAWSGPSNSGTAQFTQRQDLCQVQVKAGTAATTGSQVTPSPDAGFVGLWVVTVANGQSTVTAGNITAYPGAPFLHGPNNNPLFPVSNYVATADPVAGNDNTQGYGIGSQWLNTSNNNLWECVSASTGAAVWVCVDNTPNNTNNFFVDPCCRVASIGTGGAPNISTSKKYGVVDLVQMWVSGGTVSAGTITQDSAGTCGGRTPYAVMASGVTTGAGASINARKWLESADASDLINQTCTISCKVYQNTGSSQTVTLQVNKATVVNNFSSTTNIGTSSGVSVASGVPTTVSFTVAMGSCGNGVEMIATCGFASQTTKNFEVTDWCINIGTQVVNFAIPDFAADLANAMRYYEQSYEYGTAPATATTNGVFVTNVVVAWTTGVVSRPQGFNFRVPKLIAPALTVYSPNTGASGKWYDSTAAADKSITIAADTRFCAPANNTGGTIAAGDGLLLHFVADARL